MARDEVFTQPIDPAMMQRAPHLTVADSVTGSDQSVYVHEDLRQVIEPWAIESHIAPFKASEKFGDVDSFVDFVQRFSQSEHPPFLTWSERGLRGVLDYGSLDAPSRQQVVVEHPFVRSIQWNAWQRIANGSVMSQKSVIEAFEDLAEDIKTPDQATLVAMLRELRTTSNTKAEVELRPDGTTSVSYTKNQTVDVGNVTLPSEVVIAIPVLKGHVEMNDDDKVVPVVYSLPVRIRVSVNDDSQAVFRLSMPTAERVLEAVYEDRVDAARLQLGSSVTLLRAAS